MYFPLLCNICTLAKYLLGLSVVLYIFKKRLAINRCILVAVAVSSVECYMFYKDNLRQACQRFHGTMHHCLLLFIIITNNQYYCTSFHSTTRKLQFSSFSNTAHYKIHVKKYVFPKCIRPPPPASKVKFIYFLNAQNSLLVGPKALLVHFTFFSYSSVVSTQL